MSTEGTKTKENGVAVRLLKQGYRLAWVRPLNKWHKNEWYLTNGIGQIKTVHGAVAKRLIARKFVEHWKEVSDSDIEYWVVR